MSFVAQGCSGLSEVCQDNSELRYFKWLSDSFTMIYADLFLK